MFLTVDGLNMLRGLRPRHLRLAIANQSRGLGKIPNKQNQSVKDLILRSTLNNLIFDVLKSWID